MSSMIGDIEIFNVSNYLDTFMKRKNNGTDHFRIIAKGNKFDGKEAKY